MKSSDKKKANQGAKALKVFLEQFGNPDTYNKIVLETLFEEMTNHESISVSGATGQKGDKATDPPEVKE
jgi:hypothetical protein